MPRIGIRKPKTRKTTIKAAVQQLTRTLKPETEDPGYEFGGGRIVKKRGKDYRSAP